MLVAVLLFSAVAFAADSPLHFFFTYHGPTVRNLERFLTFVTDARTLLQTALRSYGEEELALRVPRLTDEEMDKIHDIAKQHYAALGGPLRPRGPTMKLGRNWSKAESLAAVEVIEKSNRPLKRTRRNLKRILASSG